MAPVREWVDKAEADYKGATALNRRRVEPLPDLVCFHCQQCIEKYLKRVLVQQGRPAPRIHDLLQLLNLCAVGDPPLLRLRPDVLALNPFSVQVRYPGAAATPHQARDALLVTRRLRRILRRRLGL